MLSVDNAIPIVIELGVGTSSLESQSGSSLAGVDVSVGSLLNTSILVDP